MKNKTKIQTVNLKTKTGNTISVTYNPENGLLTLDLVDKKERGGNELFRRNLSMYDEVTLLAHCLI